MQIDYLGSQIDLTPALKEYIEMRVGALGRFLKRYEQNGEVKVFVEVGRSTKHHKQGNVFYAEATLPLPGSTLRAEHYDEDARVAIDRVKDVLHMEIKKYKEKDTKETVRKNQKSNIKNQKKGY